MNSPSHIYAVLKIAVIAAMSVTALALLMFGPRAEDAYPKNATLIDYWEKWNGDEEAAMRQIVNDFNGTVGREKHIYVRYLSTSDIEKKTLVATAGGVPPDVAGLYNQDIAQFSAMGAIQPIDDMARSRGIASSQYKKVFWDECQYDNHLYGLVSTGYDLALYYNTDIFRDNAALLRSKGLDPDRAPRTIAELDAYAAALDKKDSAGHLQRAGYIPLEPGWYQSYTCIWFGGSWWDSAHNRFTFTNPGVVAAYDWIQSYSKRLGPKAETEFRFGAGNFDSPQNDFLAGVVAMEQQGTFFANFILKNKPSLAGHWAAAPFPSNDPKLKNATYCNCDILCIPVGAKHRQEAMEFIAFTQRQDEMEKLANLHCKISPLASVSESFLAHHRNPYIRVFDELAASPNAVPGAPVPILNEVTDEMNNFVQRLVMLQTTPEQGLSEMQARLQKSYDEFIQQQRGAKQ